jgi:hypothetical protein
MAAPPPPPVSRLALVVICDEDAWLPPPAVCALAAARPGCVAMVRPEWLLDCVSCYAVLDPGVEPYRHPHWGPALGGGSVPA